MTCREKLALEYPEKVGAHFVGKCDGCPDNYGYADQPFYCSTKFKDWPKCRCCWDRDVKE